MVSDQAIASLADRLTEQIGGGSVAGTPAGSRREGGLFEGVIAASWQHLLDLHQPHVRITRSLLPRRPFSSQQPIALEARNDAIGTRLFLYISNPESDTPDAIKYPVSEPDIPPSWLQVTFPVSEILEQHLGRRVFEFAPPTPEDSPRYWGEHYPSLYSSQTTSFDSTIALVKNHTLIEKMLLEYKYAKSTRGVAIDGNAHERLSFQVLQYLETASKYTRCSFNVITSDAFVKYANKYHPSFHQQALRLGDAFDSFRMRVVSCRSEYRDMFMAVSRFLTDGIDIPRDYFRER